MEFGRLLSADLISLMKGNLDINSRFLGGWDLVSPNRKPAWALWSKATTVIFFVFFLSWRIMYTLVYLLLCGVALLLMHNPQPLGSSIFPSPTSFVSRGLKKIVSRTRTLHWFV